MEGKGRVQAVPYAVVSKNKMHYLKPYVLLHNEMENDTFFSFAQITANKSASCREESHGASCILH
jgi:hypothetical protein